jgi:hypothetical protein
MSGDIALNPYFSDILPASACHIHMLSIAYICHSFALKSRKCACVSGDSFLSALKKQKKPPWRILVIGRTPFHDSASSLRQ